MAFPTNPDIGDTHVEFDTTWTYGTTGWYRTIIGSSNETFYDFSRGGGATPAGTDGDVQINDNGDLGFVSGFRWDPDVLSVPGDLNLDDGGSFQTTLQIVTPTQDRTITFPDLTGTVGLVAGSSGQAIYNDAGAYSGLSTVTTDGTNVTLSGRFIGSLNGAASAPPATLTGTWFTDGTATTTKPQALIEPTGTTSTAWSTSGTGIGVNAASGFAGNLLDLQVNGTSQLSVNSAGLVSSAGSAVSGNCFRGNGGRILLGNATGPIAYLYRTNLGFYWTGTASDSGVGVFNIPNSLNISGSTTQAVTTGVILARDADNILAQRNGTDAQTTRVYNTFTSATNFERAKLQWDTNVLKVGTEKGADGGTARDMELQTDGTTRITLKADGAILFAGLPTSDPTVAGQLWNDGGTLKISAG